MNKNISIILIAIGLALSACAGKDGSNGIEGKNGLNGKDGFNGKDGINGKDGANGLNGKDGINGYQDIYNKTKAIYSTYRRSVYRIVVQCNATAVSFASGFKVSETQVATNKHVTNYVCPSGQVKRFLIQAVYSNLDTLEARTGLYGNGDCYSSDIASKVCIFSSSFVTSSDYDLAKINIPSGSLVGAPVSLLSSNESYDLIKTGRWTVSMSFPLGFEDLYTLLGQISVNYIGDCHGGSSYGCPGLSYDFASTNDTDHGSSGSPIFDLDTGKVIGVTTAGTNGENMNTTWVIEAHKLVSF